jgi:hypothetical protein
MEVEPGCRDTCFGGGMPGERKHCVTSPGPAKNPRKLRTLTPDLHLEHDLHEQVAGEVEV